MEPGYMDIENSSKVLLQLLMQLPCHIYWEDINGVTLGCNQQVADFLGFDSPKDMVGKSREELYPKSDVEPLNNLLKTVASSGQPISIQEYANLSNGRTVCFQSYKAPLTDEGNNVIGLIGISFDITQDKTEINFLKNLINILPGNIWWTDIEGKMLGSNLQMSQAIGFSRPEDLIGLDHYALLDPEIPETKKQDIIKKINQNDEKVLNTGVVFKGEEEVVCNGKNTVYLSTKAPLRDLDDNIVGIVGVSQDITENKNEREILRHILSILPGHVWWKNLSGEIQGCNYLMARRLGFEDIDHIIGKKTIHLFSNKLSDSEKNKVTVVTEKIDQQVMCDGQPFEGEEEGEVDGIIRTFYSQKVPLKDLDGNITGLVGIAQDITELKETQEKLKAANEVKSEFIANMSHDLRTPITGMLSESEYIEEHAKDDEVRICGKYLKEATQQLLRLSNDILEYVSLESGHFDEPITVFNPIEVVENVVTLMRVSMRNKNLTFKVEIGASVPSVVKGYGQYFERIVSNLIANAIKFTSNGFVAVNLHIAAETSDEVTVKLTVEDTGVGIPADKYEEIFDQFAKLSSSYQGVYKGSGLGLYSVKQYIGQMQGHIKVESVVGKGTKFIVTLPFDKAQAAQTVQLNFDRVTAPVEINQESCEITQLDTSVNKKIKILVVEDSPLPARAVMRLLNDYNCEVKLIETGEEAVKAALKKHYDLILMDIGLPGIDGIEATKQIRALPENNDAPIVALTGHARGKHEAACMEAGMQNVYTKPLSRHQLKSLFKTFVDQDNQEAPSEIQLDVEKYILDIDAMLEQFAVQNPLQLLDMLEATLDFIPKEIKQLKQAVYSNNLARIRIIVQDLKGGLAYIVAPECNDLILRWDNVLRYEDPVKDSLNNMFQQIEQALGVLQSSIEKVVGVLKK
jgi:PAS domain S-box-containing protein